MFKKGLRVIKIYPLLVINFWWYNWKIIGKGHLSLIPNSLYLLTFFEVRCELVLRWGRVEKCCKSIQNWKFKNYFTLTLLVSYKINEKKIGLFRLHYGLGWRKFNVALMPHKSPIFKEVGSPFSCSNMAVAAAAAEGTFTATAKVDLGWIN